MGAAFALTSATSPSTWIDPRQALTYVPPVDDRAEMLPVLDACRVRGARACEVLLQRFAHLVLTGSRARPTRTDEDRWTLRVWLEGGRAGIAVAATPRGLVDAAMGAAALAPLSPYAGPADRLLPLSGSLSIDDRRHGTIEENDRTELLSMAERTLTQTGVGLRRLRYMEVRERRSWMSSRDQELSVASTTYSLDAQAGIDGVELKHCIASRHFSDVASLPFGTELRRRLEGLRTPVALPVEPLPVVLDPRAAADFLRRLAPAFTATAVRGGNFLASRLGRPLANPVLHMTDDAGLTSGLYSRNFDDRGVPPIPVTLLKEGVPTSLYHDPESAREFGLRPTGHVCEAGVRPSNLIVRPGARTRNVILAELKDYLMIDEMPFLDLVTGAVAGPVRVGVVRAGQREGAAHVNLATTVPDLLTRVVEVASDQERNGEVDSPTLVLSPLSFSA